MLTCWDAAGEVISGLPRGTAWLCLDVDLKDELANTAVQITCIVSRIVIFQLNCWIGPNKIPVPEAFFKVILCDNPLKGIGFICRNTDGNRKKDFYVNSIRQIERVTGYDFFPILPDSIKNIVETCSNLADWDWTCDNKANSSWVNSIHRLS